MKPELTQEQLRVKMESDIEEGKQKRLNGEDKIIRKSGRVIINETKKLSGIVQ